MIEMDARVEKRLSAENSVLNTNPLLKKQWALDGVQNTHPRN